MIRDRRMGTHLFIVITDPDAASGRVVVVPIVTTRTHTDRTVELNVGDHPFIRHSSSVDFGSSRYANVAVLLEKIGLGEATVADEVEPAVLRRVQHGLLRSSHTINEIATYCRGVFDVA